MEFNHVKGLQNFKANDINFLSHHITLFSVRQIETYFCSLFYDKLVIS